MIKVQGYVPINSGYNESIVTEYFLNQKFKFLNFVNNKCILRNTIIISTKRSVISF